MAIIQPNFEEQQGVPPGIYRARFASCEQKTGKTSGKPYLNWKLVIEHSNPNIHGQWVFLMTGLTGKGATIIREIVRATIDENYESGPIDTDAINGFPVEIRVEQGFNQDGSVSKYPAVTEIMPVSDAAEDFA